MQSKAKKSSFIKRHIVAAAVLPFLIAYLYYLPPFPYYLALLLTVSMVALWEFYSMYKVPVKLYVPGMIIGGALLYVSCRYPDYFLHGVFVSFFLLLLLRLFLVSDPSGSMDSVGPLGAGLLYIICFMSFHWLLRMEDPGREYIFLLYTSGWLSDGGAYYIGTYLGKNKLYPSISPNKTVEGAFGSIIGGIIGAFAVRSILDVTGLSASMTFVIGAAIGAASLLGDLIESMFKRDAGVKDSGVLIPGHGGMLDKLDGLLAAGPVLYFIVRYF